MRFDLESECKCNRKYKITGFASLLTIGAGLKFARLGMLADMSGAGGQITLTDPWADCPDPTAATGFAWSSGINVVTGTGGSLLSVLDLGRLTSWGYAQGPSYGLDFSIQSTIPFLARSVVTDVTQMDCCSQ